MRWTATTVADWLLWESTDRQSAWTGLEEITGVVARKIGARFRMQSADREDLAADVLCVAVEDGCARMRVLDGAASLPAWLWGVARNLARERLRAWAHVRLGFDAEAAEEVAALGDAPSEAAPPRYDVRLLLGLLTDEQREVELALLDGRSERAIARELRISRNAVRERMARGRRRMRQRVAGAPDAGSSCHALEAKSPIRYRDVRGEKMDAAVDPLPAAMKAERTPPPAPGTVGR